MKRFAVSLIATILAFTAGLVTASSWNSNANESRKPVTIKVHQPCAPTPPQPPAPVKSLTVNAATPAEFLFGQKGLRLVPERVQLKSRSYEIDVTYPQIVGADYIDPTNIRRVNQHLKESVTKLYQWPLNPAELDRRSYQTRLGIRDAVNFTYDIGLATDSLLSVQFIGYSFDALSGNQLQDSFTLNYDLISGKNLKLSDLFKPRSKYLQFISRYCIDELSTDSTRKLIFSKLAPAAENFQRWQISPNGIVFSFHSCRVGDCSQADMEVEIPFEGLRPLLNPGTPGKFRITYP